MIDKFGRLQVVREGDPYISPKGKRAKRFICDCDCGARVSVMAKKLKSGHTKSCGCLWRERITKHGHNTKKKSPTYHTWDAMVQRCHNPRHSKYYMYGARGISVCDSWRDSFSRFLEDMGERPNGRTIDRLNPNGNYEAENCRWATARQQQQTTRRALSL